MTTNAKPIICCGFTPCVQRILQYKTLEKSVVNRAVQVHTCIGGKGANTARMVRQLGSEPLLIEFSGGANGRLLEKMLEAEGVKFRHVDVAGETRICQTLIEASHPEPTELVEEMPPITAAEWEQMLALVASLDLTDMATVSGKLPAGAPIDAYAQITTMVTEQGGRLILDAPGEPMLLALEHKPYLVKINDVELFDAVGGNDVEAAARQLIQQGAQSVLITRGGQTAFFMDGTGVLELVPPKIEAVNPVGSGDAVTAGIAVELNRGKEISAAVVTGMACGAANALNLVSGFLNPSDVERLRSRIELVVHSS